MADAAFAGNACRWHDRAMDFAMAKTFLMCFLLPN
jgi:hypothetical protein